MPIDRTEFEKGERSTSFHMLLLDFLTRNRGNAYTFNEIAHDLQIREKAKAVHRRVALLTSFFVFLDNLVREGKITARVVNKEHYYMTA